MLIMEHRPDTVKPRDVEDFNPKDRKIVELIDHAIEDHRLAMEGIANATAERWAEHDAPDTVAPIIS